MKENNRKKLKDTKAITLIALVITIIVLLILAGVSLSMVFNSDGLFSRANDTAKRYNKAKARETLEILLSDAQIQKYAEGLTEGQLDKKIQEIGELMDKEDPNSNIQDVIVEGHIFKIDKSVPKILEYVGPADGIIITATLSWINGETQRITVSGTIKTYSGGNIKEVTATKKDGTAISGLPQNGGEYKIENIKENTEITITVKDSKGKTSTKKVKVLFDNTKPVITEATAVASGMKIKIRAVATDDISGISGINYTVEPTTVNNASGAPASIGTIASGQELELTATEIQEYTVTFIAVDKAGNESESVISKATTEDTEPPIISSKTATATGLKIKISATATDNYSGVKQINYSVLPVTVKNISGVSASTGSFENGGEVELIASEEKEYKILFTATDNKGNTTPAVTATATTTMPEKLSVEEAKVIINDDNIRSFIGVQVDYPSPQKGTWRVFYYDGAEAYFGSANTLYLKRDYVANDTSLSDYENYTPSDGGALMKRMNPKWRDYPSKDANVINNIGEHCVAWLCDPAIWNTYIPKNSRNEFLYSSIAMGSPSVEMYIRSYNLWDTGKKEDDALSCRIIHESGYGVFSYDDGSSDGWKTEDQTVKVGPHNLFVAPGNGDWWLASPSGRRWYDYILYAMGTRNCLSTAAKANKWGVCPVVPIDL